MKKQRNNSTRAWALQVALSVALLSISAVLVASSFKATPATRGLSAPIKPVAAGDKDLVIAGPASVQSLSPADAPFTFGNTGSLNTARDGHTATLLPNGKVLVAGGNNGGSLLAARNCTTRRAGLGLPPAASPPHATVTRRRCCPTARCSSQGDDNGGISCERGTLRSGERDLDGHRQPRHRTLSVTRRRCCPTARCSSQGD